MPIRTTGQRADSPQASLVARTDLGLVAEVVYPAALAEQVAALWPPLGLEMVDPTTVGVPERRWEVRADGHDVRVLVDGEEMPGGWARLESDLALTAAEHLRGVVAVHAALVLHHGLTLLVPGSSGVGKSSLCIAAAEVGASVLTDEYALVEPATGLVTGWRRAVRKRLPGGGVDRLHLVVESPPVPVGLVALVEYDPALGDQRGWAPISPADAALGIMANTVCASSRPDESLDAALAIARRARAVGGTRGEASSTVRALLAALAD